MSIKKSDNIDDVLKEAAAKTGASNDTITYLKKTAMAESEGILGAANPKSNARGRWQFMPETYAKLADKYKDKYPELKSTDGRDARFIPDKEALGAVVFTIENEEILKNNVGKNLKITDGIRYLAHFAGPGKASEVLLSDPDKPINRILSPLAMKQNEDVYLKHGKEKLYFKDFKARDLIAWADRKMDQPSNYGSMTEVERTKYRKDKHIPDGTPEAFGDMVMTIITVAIGVISSLIGGATDLVTSVFGNSSLPSPSTPNMKLASAGKNTPAV